MNETAEMDRLAPHEKVHQQTVEQQQTVGHAILKEAVEAVTADEIEVVKLVPRANGGRTPFVGRACRRVEFDPTGARRVQNGATGAIFGQDLSTDRKRPPPTS